MSITLETVASNAACDAVVDLVDAGAGAGVLRLRTGTSPGGGTLLAAIDLNDPAFGAAANGVATLDVAGGLSTVGVADGIARHFEILDGDGVRVLSGDVGETGSNATLEIASTTVDNGGTVEVTSGTITQPAGG